MMSFVNNRISLRIVTPSSNVVKGHYLKVMNLLIMYSIFVQTTSSGLVAKLTTWQSGLEVRITVVFLSAYH